MISRKYNEQMGAYLAKLAQSKQKQINTPTVIPEEHLVKNTGKSRDSQKITNADRIPADNAKHSNGDDVIDRSLEEIRP